MVLKPPPLVPPDQVVAHAREADVCLVLIEATCLSYHLSSPNKMFEALAAGTPPLCTDLPEARRALGAHADRWVLTDPDALGQAIRTITREDSESFRASWGPLGTWEDEARGWVDDVRDRVETAAHSRV